MTDEMSRQRMRFMWFDVASPAGPAPVAWDSPANRDFDYLDLNHWIELAKLLESAKFDGIFWADVISVHDEYTGPKDQTSRDTGIRRAVMYPGLDPICLAAAVASATTNLGLVVSSNMVSKTPYIFAREMATLDHLTKGRVGWNIVTSFQQSSWLNTGHTELATSARRYEQAEEYVQVLYRLLEGSWEDGAVVRDYESGTYADPSKVHLIEPVPGPYQGVKGPSPCEPSVQRMPFLFQAGSSKTGRDFAARNAEAVFQAAPNPKGAKIFVDYLKTQLAAAGRNTDDVIVFGAFPCVFGATEEEAKRKDAELLRYVSEEGLKCFYSSALGLDLGLVDVNKPIGELNTDGALGHVKQIIESIPYKDLSFRDYYMSQHNNRFVGTGEQFADMLEEWRDAGVLGVNLMSLTGKADLKIFAESIAPVLQARGLMQSDYGQYPTLREKMFDGCEGALLNARHPAAKYRREVRQPQEAAAV